MKVVPYKNLPTTFPFVGTAVIYLLLDKWHVPGWVWGVVGTLVVIRWSIAIAMAFVQKQTDIFAEGKK